MEKNNTQPAAPQVLSFLRKPAKMGDDFIFWIPRLYIKNGLVDPAVEYKVILEKQPPKAVAHLIHDLPAAPGGMVKPARTAPGGTVKELAIRANIDKAIAQNPSKDPKTIAGSFINQVWNWKLKANLNRHYGITPADPNK